MRRQQRLAAAQAAAAEAGIEAGAEAGVDGVNDAQAGEEEEEGSPAKRSRSETPDAGLNSQGLRQPSSSGPDQMTQPESEKQAVPEERAAAQTAAEADLCDSEMAVDNNSETQHAAAKLPEETGAQAQHVIAAGTAAAAGPPAADMTDHPMEADTSADAADGAALSAAEHSTMPAASEADRAAKATATLPDANGNGAAAALSPNDDVSVAAPAAIADDADAEADAAGAAVADTAAADGNASATGDDATATNAHATNGDAAATHGDATNGSATADGDDSTAADAANATAATEDATADATANHGGAAAVDGNATAAGDATGDGFRVKMVGQGVEHPLSRPNGDKAKLKRKRGFYHKDPAKVCHIPCICVERVLPV